MFRHFLRLEWKSFVRSASFGTSLFMKILLGLLALWMAVSFISVGSALYFILEEMNLEPLKTVNKYLIYYLVADLMMRYFLQKLPVMNIKPLLAVPIKRKTIVHFSLGKNLISFFNVIHLFWLIPFTVVLLIKDFPLANVLSWHFGVLALFISGSLLNLLINNKNAVFVPVAVLVAGFAISQYYGWFDITIYTAPIFDALFDYPFLFLIPFLIFAALYYAAFNYFHARLHLDTGLAVKSDSAKTEDFTWLNQFGTMGTFLKNDIRLLKRNKRSKTTVIMSVVFIFYGLLFFTNAIEGYQNPAMQVFAGIFVSGGFLFTFGQFVPSWDSAYYQLMMSQNIQYKEYLASKWWLMVIATVISTVIASFYLAFGWRIYALIVVGAIYNIGVNSHLVLLAGAYVKTPIDLSSSKGAFGDKQAFNIKTLLISLPKLLIPMGLYSLGYFLFSEEVGFLFVTAAGVIGFAFKNSVFSLIERIYKSEKYKTIEAYKQKN